MTFCGPHVHMTIGDRAFPVAGARVWKALPSFVTDLHCSHIQASLEDVPLCLVSFLRQGPRKEVCFKLPHSH